MFTHSIYSLYILIFSCIVIGIFLFLFYFIYLYFISKNIKNFYKKFSNFISNCILFNWIDKLIFNPIIPSTGIVIIGNCTVYLAKVPFKLSHSRLNLETLCLIDLYYHKKRENILKNKQEISSIIYTAVSEESYLQSQLLLKSSNSLDITFQKAINEYINCIKWSTNVRNSYNPQNNIIYFSSIN